MLTKITKDNVLAFAGIIQVATLVKQLAWKGSVNNKDIEGSLYSLFQIDAPNCAAVYGGQQNLELGLRKFIEVFNKSNYGSDNEIARYALSIIHLEKTLRKHDDMLDAIRNGIKRASGQLKHFPLTHDNIIANLASVYTDTLSTLRFRIHITGEANLLQNANILNKIRALLLAGIRSCVLWKQLDGSRFNLVLARKQMLAVANILLQEIELTTEVDHLELSN